MPAATCKEIFDKMPSRFNPEGAKDWNAVIQFNISGDKGGDYTVRVKDGTCTVAEGVDAEANTTITTNDETWIGMINGTVNAMMAFTMGKLKIKGEMGNAMKLNNPAIFKPGAAS